jgi:ribosomal protein L7/L12
MGIIKVLMHRDGLSLEDAKDLVKELRTRVLEGDDPEEILHDELGLEPDYIFDLISF